MTGLGSSQQNGAHGNAFACDDLEQVEGDIRRIQGRHNEQVGLPLEFGVGECAHADFLG